MVVLKFFKKGERHPPHGWGSYVGSTNRDEAKRRAEYNWGPTDHLRKVCPTKEKWMERYPLIGGHELFDDAWIYIWLDVELEENEFGPVTP